MSVMAAAPEPVRDTYTIDEVALRLGVSRNHIVRTVRSGELPSIWLGRRILIPVTEYEKWLRGDAA
jgi:excisionase family DNA binding protein